MDSFALPLAWYVIFLFSIVVHEAAHAWAALRGGDPTAFDGGQVSLNPIPHIQREPVGMVLLPIVFLVLNGYPLGYASAPVNPQWAWSHPKRAAVMAAAGPLGNALIVIAAIVLINMFGLNSSAAVISAVGGEPSAAAMSSMMLLKMLLVMNVILACFNMLPLPPLDGATMITGLMSEENARKFMLATASPIISIIGILIAWQLFPLILGPILSVVYLFI